MTMSAHHEPAMLASSVLDGVSFSDQAALAGQRAEGKSSGIIHPGDFPALLLNADWQPVQWFPLSTLSWQDAVMQVCKRSVEVIAEYDREIRSQRTTMRLPSVVVLKNYVLQNHKVHFCRRNILLRDRYRCGYCGKKFPASELTFEHVTPRARGGPTTWDNIISACIACNSAKADAMLDRSGGLPGKIVNDKRLRLIRWPHKPTAEELRRAGKEFPPPYIHETWREWLYFDAPLDGSDQRWDVLKGVEHA